MESATQEEEVGSEERPHVRNVVALLCVGETAREGAVSTRPPTDASFTHNFYNFHRIRTPVTSPAPGSHRPPRFAFNVFLRSGLVIATGIPHLDAVARSARVFRHEYEDSAGRPPRPRTRRVGRKRRKKGRVASSPRVHGSSLRHSRDA